MTRKYESDYTSSYYTDEGCELHSSCLNCPLPKCALDEIRGVDKEKKKGRDSEIRQRFAKGERAKDLAKSFELDIKTIYRILQDREDG